MGDDTAGGADVIRDGLLRSVGTAHGDMRLSGGAGAAGDCVIRWGDVEGVGLACSRGGTTARGGGPSGGGVSLDAGGGTTGT